MLIKLVICVWLANFCQTACLTVDGPYGDSSLATNFDDLQWLT
jgi:hypothetical protein